MFEFKDLDRESRLTLLKEKQEAVRYWQSLHRLQGILIGFGTRAADVLQEYVNAGGTGMLAKDLAKVGYSDQVTVRKLANMMKRVDDYIKDIDARLDDGSRWMTPQDIADLSHSPDL